MERDGARATLDETLARALAGALVAAVRRGELRDHVDDHEDLALFAHVAPATRGAAR